MITIFTAMISFNVLAGDLWSNNNSWSYEAPNNTLKYNSFNQEWSYEPPNSSLKYNSFNQQWSYESPNSTLRYNPYKY